IYKKALDEFEKIYANDPSAQLSLIDAYILRRDYPKALKAIDIIDTALHTDPFLNYFRALIVSQMNDVERAIQYLEALRKDKPEFVNGIIELISNYLFVENYDKAEKLVSA